MRAHEIGLLNLVRGMERGKRFWLRRLRDWRNRRRLEMGRKHRGS